MNNFKEIKLTELPFSPFDIKDKWMLVTAQKDGKVNTMTASWGMFGIMWNKEVVSVVIRPQRYTKEFIDNADSFSITLFDKNFKKELGYLGTVSGRDEDKIAKAGLTVVHKNNVPFFDEAEVVIIAKKLYSQPWDGDFFVDAKLIDQWYPEKDFHTMYVAEIETVLKKD
ncbi:flavin reductase (DIM6/NTAB) family NADH-FMN oxidoreductase RutF [Dysgonomonas sp. PH5-45]|uniref:flavin reductase family protein n=1 Tax=unclassified Dysgonomonas TaxID=2630389 RepID=UPI002473CF23|nr:MULTISPECIES: flavin reductase family protein [unclassified Dysgonomonas]MDH6354639.1 flavin reductase (DIM6/NTAB) family NADH-FMN oxidoreductase RutF [Dysgonomonas sp. PH5-45]MDH6387537.1 flavin reductase (DIM6/NTAB) family NADH-FMN oxidoreductase RutF [Dysgonomonas sp. PH5-37]